MKSYQCSRHKALYTMSMDGWETLLSCAKDSNANMLNNDQQPSRIALITLWNDETFQIFLNFFSNFCVFIEITIEASNN